MQKTIAGVKITDSDNVAVALLPIKTGEELLGVTAKADIPAGHKMALENISTGGNIIKYSAAIGHAKADITPGEHVHTHNIATNLKGILEYEYRPSLTELPKTAGETPTFMGYKRPDGQVGVRNEIWIINTVGCVNKIAERIAYAADTAYKGQVDGVYTFVHPYGCSQLGEDHGFTQGILADMVRHPNAAGVLVLGLGCENNNIAEFKKVVGTWDDKRVKFLNAQDTKDEVADALALIDELADYAKTFKREPIGVDKLIVGLKCGGSDGLSGITANVLAGSLSDRLISYGGSAILTEVPEMFGAETILMNRCTTKEVFRKSVKLINDFKDYFTRHGQEIYENPSPGNKDGGISTLEDKSLGCTQKGGISPVVDVLDYGERVKLPGLNLLQGPGNDIVAVTNLMAAGAHIVLFTTGRGTPLGGIVPTVKISSNTALAEFKPSWIDFNAGVLVEDESLAETTARFFDYIVEVASGKSTKNEENGYREISIFKDGVTL